MHPDSLSLGLFECKLVAFGKRAIGNESEPPVLRQAYYRPSTLDSAPRYNIPQIEGQKA